MLNKNYIFMANITTKPECCGATCLVSLLLLSKGLICGAPEGGHSTCLHPTLIPSSAQFSFIAIGSTGPGTRYHHAVSNSCHSW